MPPTRAQLVDQLQRIIEIKLLDPLEILLAADLDAADSDATALHTAGPRAGAREGAGGVADELRGLLRGRVDRWAWQMTGDDDRVAVGAVMRVMSTLYPGDGPFDPPVHWWSSPLGQVLAYRVGHPVAESVPYPVAGAMLGITRQGVHDLIARGKLRRHPDGGVVPASIRARLLQLEEGSRRP
ncbi:hypothetical protein GCM10023322_80450 [Rugosimonospora acidiphila]|uniref:DNA-binding protein n=1 Tax=Rugosimonospora acidiphila TaxID=556531 RepID=A0ABP9SU49_9ACTN